MPHRKVSASLERRMQLMVEGHRGVLLLYSAWNARKPLTQLAAWRRDAC